MFWATIIPVIYGALGSHSAARAAAEQQAGIRRRKPRDLYPLRQKPTPTYWSGFAPIVVPLFYACGIVGAVCGVIWLVGAVL